jgi:hypothetical protein
MPGQQADAKQNGQQTAPLDGQHTAPALAVRARPWIPRPSAPAPHGGIADGESPKTRLEMHRRWSVEGDSLSLPMGWGSECPGRGSG